MPPSFEQRDLFSELPTSSAAPASVASETRSKVASLHPDAPLKLVASNDKGMMLLLSLQKLLQRIDTDNAKIELAKIESITFYEDRVRLGILDLMRKNHSLPYESVRDCGPEKVLSIEEWSAIVGSMPSQVKISAALPSIADIQINKAYWAYDRNRFGKNTPGMVVIFITDTGRIEKNTSLEKASIKPFSRLSDDEIASRHEVGMTDGVVDYLTKMERFYAIGGTRADAREFMKVRNITLTPETITIGGLTLQRKKIGVLNRDDAKIHLPNTPTIAQWEAIFKAIPGGSEWSKAMKTLLDIDLDKNLWTHDAHDRGSMIIMETNNVVSRTITRDDNALGKASLFQLAK